MKRSVSFTLNGEPTNLVVDDERHLLWVLRHDLGLTGTKFACGEGLCGACTIVVDGEAIRSCATQVKEIEGKKILTIEGLAQDGELHPLQRAFVEERAFQCGFCTSGMILNAYAMLLKTPHPPPAEIVQQLNDHLCGCGSHVRITRAVRSGAEAMRGDG